jgi:hypothetical protein
MCEHPFAVLELTTAEAARVRPVEARRMAFETYPFETFGALPAEVADEPDHHDADDTSEA